MPDNRAPTLPPADPAATRARLALLYQLLETEMGGVQIYRTALQCALDPQLKTEWARYLAQTERHVIIARELLERVGLDPDAELPARLLCRHDAEGMVNLMLEALAAGTPGDAQLCAAECVVKAETKDHMNWSLLGHLARVFEGPAGDAMRMAYVEIEHEEDHHLYHSKGWARELWAQALGLPAVLPPPEEQRDVESAMEAALAEEARDELAAAPGAAAPAGAERDDDRAQAGGQ
jgi:hypothetical protein